MSAALAADPQVDPDREVRIALVLYGGVSLAVYIHGVTQELLRAVRATAPAASRPGPQPALLSGDELTPVERLYRELGQRVGSPDPFRAEVDPPRDPVRSRFVVDLISGTSAGGINGVFLAKALANELTLDELRRLWLQEADLDRLLNDRRSVADLPGYLRLERPPQALLNTRRLLQRLLLALDGLDRTRRSTVSTSRLVEELDLFVTATDVRGLTLPVALWDRAVLEKRYRSVFRFAYASPRAAGRLINDFRPESNGMLAFAARCTSSFPVAFEPMVLDDLRRVRPWFEDPDRFREDVADWRRFFPDYLRRWRAGGPAPGPEAFVTRSFADGGYLDNKPFSYPIDALGARRSNRRVVRKLFYVEPSPDDLELEAGPEERPDAIENLRAAALQLPRAETIREDLERIQQRNRVVERVAGLLDALDVDLLRREPPPVMTAEAFARSGLTPLVDRCGGGYVAYHRLKVDQVTRDLARLVQELSGIDEGSGLLPALELLVGLWRDETYLAEADAERSAARTENRFLLDLDVEYRARRLRFLADRLDLVLAVLGREERRATAARHDAALRVEAGPKEESWRIHAESRAADRRRERDHDLRALAALFAETGITAEAWLAPESRMAIRRAVVGFADRIQDLRTSLRVAERERHRHDAANPLVEALGATGISVEELRWIVENPLPEERRTRAREVLGQPANRRGAIERFVGRLADARAASFRELSRAALELLAAPTRTADLAAVVGPDPFESAIRLALRRLYDRFDCYDAALHPLTAELAPGEIAEVHVIRVSPKDSTLLSEYAADGARRLHKLAGTRFGNFGSFLDPAWRRSDLLWGRLDGAERIVQSVLVPATRAEEHEQGRFVRRLQAAIVSEELGGLGAEEARRIFYQCALRTTSGAPAEAALVELAAALHPPLAALDPATAGALDPEALRRDYLRGFARERGLDPARGLPLLGRASRVLGELLQGLGDRYGASARRGGRWLLWLGRALWGIVEVSLPRTVAAILTRYWLSLGYLVAGLQIVAGMLFGWPAVRGLGIRLLLILLAVDVALRLIRSLVQRRLRLRTAAVVVGTVLALVGAWHLLGLIPGVAPWIDRQLTTAMDLLRGLLAPLWAIGRRLCPKC